MAPIKFEEHIKEQLEERRIEPSAAGWERLSGQLDMQQGKKKNKRVLWMSIAASFIIGVGLTAVFLQNNTTDAGPVVVMPEKTETQKVIKENSEKLNAPLLDTQMAEEQVAQLKTPISKGAQKIKETKTTQKRKATREQLPVMSNNITEAVATTNTTQNSQKASVQQENQTAISPFKESVVLKDITLQRDIEAVAQTENKEVVTDQEIDALLSNAQRDIISDQLINNGNITIDANALLLDVEAEVDPQRFKDKIFRALKQEVGKAVDAVANKDN